MRHTVGFNLQIFNPNEYPDNGVGVMQQQFINPNSDIHFAVTASTIESSIALKPYSPIKRGCLFPVELYEDFQGHYSYPDCLMKCKMKNIFTLCECGPLFLTGYYLGTSFPPITCTLIHNKCVHRFQCKIQMVVLDAETYAAFS